MLILHGSATGNSTDAASSLFRLARRYKIEDLELSSLQDLDLVKLVEAQFAVFVVSTTGNGDIPASMQAFWSTVLRSDIDKALFEDLDFVVLGLGDSKYKQFNWTAKKLRRRLTQLGAHEAMDTVLCDDSANEGMETAFLPFLRQFEQLLRTLNDGADPIHKDTILPPVMPVSRRRTPFASYSNGHRRDQGSGQRNKAHVVQNKRLTPASHFQDVRSLTLTVQCDTEMTIEPGDVLSLVPSSPAVSVERFLTLLEWQEDADVLVDLPESCKALSLFDDPRRITLRELITRTIPLHAVPPLSLFSQLRQFATNADFKEKFDEWEELDGKDDVYDYLTRPRRTLLEVIEDFASGIKVPIEYCLDLFGTTVPRSYSIAGSELSPKTAARSEGEHQDNHDVELLVAMVQYQTKIKEPRRGFASRYLSSLYPTADPPDENSGFWVKIEKPIAVTNVVPIPAKDIPLLMICTGTGLAPLRFLLMRLFRAPGPIVARRVTLFFGCRSLDDDLVTLTIPAAIREQIKISHAYSRLPGEPRIYVQDLVRKKQALVDSIVTDSGVVYLCGSSGAMPDSVREAIDEVLGPGTVENLEEKGRWWQETW